MSRFIYDADIPTLILPELMRYFEPLDLLIPAWCTRVFVGWRGSQAEDAPTAVAQTQTNYPYRWARIMVYGRWTDEAEGSKRNIATHEVMHISLELLYAWAADAIKRVGKDNQGLVDFLIADAKERLESVTEDLTLAIERLSALIPLEAVWTAEPLAPSVKPNGHAHSDTTPS